MKRGESGLSLIVGINKPIGMTSHDVVNCVRTVFGEKRVGHAGTLDPAASGVLPVCVGPATRLADYLGGCAKRYRATIAFGSETTTDDTEGDITFTAEVPDKVFDASFAEVFVSSLVGEHEQVPPQYSAIKSAGQRSYDLARKGIEVDLSPRTITVFDACLLAVEESSDGTVSWVVDFEVSKGTYIRSLARDIGRMLGSAAHLTALERTQVGRMTLEECVSLDTLAAIKLEAVLDPVRVLGMRFAFADDLAPLVVNGAALQGSELDLFEPLAPPSYDDPCACTSTLCRSADLPEDGEIVCVLVDNRLKALYRYDWPSGKWHPACVFSVGIVRS